MPGDEVVATLVADFLAALADKKKAAGHAAVASAEFSESDAEIALKATIDPSGSWAQRFTEHGSGADVHSSFLHNGFVTASHLASWSLLEQRYEALLDFLQENFEGFKIRERQVAKVRVEVPLLLVDDSPRKLSSMFGLIEERHEELHVLEYSISQTSLEQIFNSFAMQQTGEAL